MYLENLTIIGGNKGCLWAQSNPNDGYKTTVLAKNCRFLYSKTADASRPVINIKGCDTIFQNCEASYGDNDGFNYHDYLGVKSKSIEINCIASNNGSSKTTCNASTTHDGNKVLRINGEYYNSYGPNVADVRR